MKNVHFEKFHLVKQVKLLNEAMIDESRLFKFSVIFDLIDFRKYGRILI